MNYIEVIENYLCDLCDEAFADGIVCDKIFNPEEQVTRSAYVVQQLDTLTDQDGIRKYIAQISENRKARSECIHDMSIIDSNFRKYSKKLDNGLVISVAVRYIIAPIKVVVGTQTAYNLSANLEIKLT